MMFLFAKIRTSLILPIGSLNLHLVDSTIKKPMGRINDVLIFANRNYVPIYFIVLDIDCNPSCPIIFDRPFLERLVQLLI